MEARLRFSKTLLLVVPVFLTTTASAAALALLGGACCAPSGTDPLPVVEVDLSTPASTTVDLVAPGPKRALLPYLVIHDHQGAGRPVGEPFDGGELILALTVEDEAGSGLYSAEYDQTSIRYGNWALPHTALVLDPSPTEGELMLEPGARCTLEFEVRLATEAFAGSHTELALVRPEK